MKRLDLVGNPRPVPNDRISLALPEAFAALPASYVELMTSWGPGLLCGAFDLPDPSSHEFRDLQNRLRVHGAVYHAAGHWAQLSQAELGRAVVLGTDRRGFALVVHGTPEVVVLQPRGLVLRLSSFDGLIDLLVDGAFGRTRALVWETRARGDWSRTSWFDDELPLDLGVPAVHVTTTPPAWQSLFDALARGDESAADEWLEVVLASEVALYALLDLLALLASPEGGRVTPELRATYAEQLFRMARRRAPSIANDVSFDELKSLLRKGEDAPQALLDAVRFNPCCGASWNGWSSGR
jgi:AcrR family transcriptional regulator